MLSALLLWAALASEPAKVPDFWLFDSETHTSKDGLVSFELPSGWTVHREEIDGSEVNFLLFNRRLPKDAEVSDDATLCEILADIDYRIESDPYVEKTQAEADQMGTESFVKNLEHYLDLIADTKKRKTKSYKHTTGANVENAILGSKNGEAQFYFTQIVFPWAYTMMMCRAPKKEFDRSTWHFYSIERSLTVRPRPAQPPAPAPEDDPAAAPAP